MLSKEDRRIPDLFSSRLREQFPNARIWAFGSRARGNTNWDADFDLCIVLDEFSEDADRWIRNVAWEIGFENDRVISTIVLDRGDFEHGPMSESTHVANILREGIPA